jgi:lipid A ethanolaminephosphotransferase
MFSPQSHDSYSRSLATHSENLLDVLSRSGVRVVWRENDGGSKGVADRVAYENMAQRADPQLCKGSECYDEVLLQGLEALMTSSPGDTLVVLHTQGSHGPSYYKRVPQRFKAFQPECAQDNVQDCSRQEIVNAYDNTILYTDYLLSRVVDILKRQEFATAMLYVSDHGESLGENGIYLHGLPYAMAPLEQTRVPMIFWASDRFYAEKRISRTALVDEQNAGLSHDNLFHSLLGLFGVESGVYRPELDIFTHAGSAAHVGPRSS